ncbi:MAG: hypothetical protein AAGH15_18770, partial [Myxococcota bacterium]
MAMAPQAQGNTRELPLERVLCTAHGKRLTGTLVVWDEGEGPPDRLAFRDGFIERVYAPDQSTDLLRLFRRKDVPFAFYAEDLIGEAGLARWVDPLPLIVTSLRSALNENLLAREVARLAERPLAVPPSRVVRRLKLTPEEVAIVHLVEAVPTTARELILGTQEPRTARRMVCLLSLLRGFGTDAGRASPGAYGGSSFPPPAPPTKPLGSRTPPQKGAVIGVLPGIGLGSSGALRSLTPSLDTV